MGAPPKPLQMWEQTLYHIRHELRTGYGESTGSYSYTAASPIFGPGQGSRGRVAAVCAMTTILLRAFNCCDPSQTKFVKTISKMFIDDASNFVNNFLQGLHFPTNQIDLTSLLSEDAQSGNVSSTHWVGSSDPINACTTSSFGSSTKKVMPQWIPPTMTPS
jgi:hypothetical protein